MTDDDWRKVLPISTDSVGLGATIYLSITWSAIIAFHGVIERGASSGPDQATLKFAADN